MSDNRGEGASPSRFSIDLVVVLAVAIGTLGLTLGSLEGPVRVALGVLFVFVAPGYAFVAVLFPGIKRDEGKPPDRRIGVDRVVSAGSGISSGERAVLSIGLSVFIIPLVGLLMNFTALGVSAFSVIAGVSVLTVALALLAAIRRLRLPSEERYGIAVGRLVSGYRWLLRTDETSFERALTLALVVGIVLATSGVVYAVTMPKQGEQFTEFYLMTRDDETGELVADGYPADLTQGESATLYVGLTNREHRTVDYTVVVELQRVRLDDGSATVIQRERLSEFDTTVGHEESWQREHEVAPPFAGDSLRLSYQLYRGEPPATPTVERAYRSVHVWIDVSPG